MNPVNSNSQWNPQGRPGGFQSDAGIPDANTPRVELPRPINKTNSSGDVQGRLMDKSFASSGLRPYSAGTAKSSSYEG